MNGEDAMVTVLFVDIRDFTRFADQATAREAVGAAQRVLRRRRAGASRRTAAWRTSSSATGCWACSARRCRCPTTPTAAWPPPARSSRPSRPTSASAAGSSVGVNSGLVLVGTIGGGSRYELGIIGDPVNVAARVEQATRRTGDDVLVTEATRCLMERDGLEPRGTLELKGKDAPVAVYALEAGR